jgi:hypothetical protein
MSVPDTDGTPSRTREELLRWLQPGPAPLIQAVTELLEHNPDQDPGTLLPLLAQAHTIRADGPQPMAPWEAALLLQALAHTEVRDICALWHDQAAWWLWSDLIHAAPSGWIAPAATLLAITAYQQGDLYMAGLAAQHAMNDRPGYALAHLVQASLWQAISPTRVRALIARAQIHRLFIIDASASRGSLNGSRPDDDPAPRPTDTQP